MESLGPGYEATLIDTSFHLVRSVVNPHTSTFGNSGCSGLQVLGKQTCGASVLSDE